MRADVIRTKRYDLSGVEIILAEPPIATRRVLRNGFYALGIRSVQEAESPLAVGGMGRTTADVLFLDATEYPREILRLVAAIRKRSTRLNPFVGIVLTCDGPTNAFIGRAGIVGADAVLVKPLSMQAVQDRITTLIEMRRPWVVTSNYVGPDRRQSDRDEADPIPKIDVPNTISRKAKQSRVQTIPEDIEEAWLRIQTEQVRRHAFQVAFLAELGRLPPTDARPNGFLFEAARIPQVLNELLGLVRDTELTMLIEPQVFVISGCIADANGAPEILTSVMPDVSRRAYDVLRLCLGGSDDGKCEAEVLRAVQSFLARLPAD